MALYVVRLYPEDTSLNFPTRVRFKVNPRIQDLYITLLLLSRYV